MNSNKPYIDHGVKWGLIMGLITGVVFNIVYFTNMRFALSGGMWIILAISLSLLIVQGLQARRFDNGALTYGKAFTTLFFAILVSSFLYVVSEYMIKNYVSPTVVEEEKTITLERTAEWMENFGSSDEDIDKAIAKIEESDFKPTLLGQLGKLFWSLLFNTIIILIIAAIVKKKPKETVLPPTQPHTT